MVSPTADNPRALAVRDAFAARADGLVIARNQQSLVFDELPRLVLNQRSELVGVSVMVRLFLNGTEVRIDPRRVFLNPATVPRANLTYEEGTLDLLGVEARFVGGGRIVAHLERRATKGVAYRRIVGAPDPEAALIEMVWDSVIGVPNARGFRTRGTVTTVFATAPGGAGTAISTDATYATARTGGTLALAGNHEIGQTTAYRIGESFIIFDTSGIPDTDTVSASILSLDDVLDQSLTDFTVDVAISTYDGGAVETTDWVSGASLPTPILATLDTSGYSAGYNAFTETADFKDAINKTGNTSLILYSDRHQAGTTPTQNERVFFTDADAAGTTTDPKLDITHAAAGGGATHPGWQQRGGWW